VLLSKKGELDHAMKMMMKHKYTLFGAGSVFNLAGASTRPVKIGDASDDIRALRSDWGIVGNEIRKATVAVKSSPAPKATRKNASRPSR